MSDMASVIRNHNTSFLKDPTPTDIKECSCRQKTECPLDKKCLSGYLVYNALVDRLDTNKTKHYCGVYEKNFKERCNNHTASFRNKNKWCIASKTHPYVWGRRKCDLCLTEKLTIIKADPETLLNTRDELVSKCRHMNKFTSRHFKKNKKTLCVITIAMICSNLASHWEFQYFQRSIYTESNICDGPFIAKIVSR